MLIHYEAEYDIDFEHVAARFHGDFIELSELDYSEDEILRMLVHRYGPQEVFDIEPDFWHLSII